MATRHKYWFGARWIGFGIGPRSWEGWATLGVYCLALLLFASLAHPSRAYFLAGFALLTLVLLVVMIVKYGPHDVRGEGDEDQN